MTTNFAALHAYAARDHRLVSSAVAAKVVSVLVLAVVVLVVPVTP